MNQQALEAGNIKQILSQHFLRVLLRYSSMEDRNDSSLFSRVSRSAILNKAEELIYFTYSDAHFTQEYSFQLFC